MDIFTTVVLLVLSLAMGGATVVFSWWSYQKFTRKGPNGGTTMSGTETTQSIAGGGGPGSQGVEREGWGASSGPPVVRVEMVGSEAGSWDQGAGIQDQAVENQDQGFGSRYQGAKKLDPGASNLDLETRILNQGARNLDLRVGNLDLESGSLSQGIRNPDLGARNLDPESGSLHSEAGNLDPGGGEQEPGVEAQELADGPGALSPEPAAGSPSVELKVGQFLQEAAGFTLNSAGEKRAPRNGNGSGQSRGEREDPGEEKREQEDGRRPGDGSGDGRTAAEGQKRVRMVERGESAAESSASERGGSRDELRDERSRVTRGRSLKTGRGRQESGREGPRGDGGVSTGRRAAPKDGGKEPRNWKDNPSGLVKNPEGWNLISDGIDEGFIEDEDVKAMLQGSYMQKIKSSSWMKSRFYKLQDDCHTVWYDSQKILKSARSQIFSIDDIQEMRPGHQSEGMQRYAMEIPTDRCFTIVFKGRRKNLDLVASDAKEARHWIDGLSKLKKRGSSMNKRERLDQWFQIYLQKADVDKDNKMTLDEVKHFMKMMNIEVDHMYAKELFKRCDRSKDGTIQGKEVEEFYKLLTEREEISTIFEAYSNKDHLMNVEKLTEFLRKEQRENVTQEYAAKLIKSYEVNEEAKHDLFMTKDGFLFFLMSPEGDVFNPEHSKVYQDMTQPLNQYYISSSHNTYLTKDQLEGPSSTEAYISALTRGCRCVELDCWDGKNGEPVIFHGYTFTSKIVFQDVINVIKNYAFKASPYPLILSLENHCSIEQQNVMAQHLKTILGDMLLTRTIDGTVPTNFASPEQLKGKILIKGKRLNRLEDDQNDENDEVSDEDEAAELEENEEQQKRKEKNTKVKLSKELSDLVIYCKSVHFNGFEDAMKNQVFYEMSSFVENKFNKLVHEAATPFIQHNTRQLSRIYPNGLRTDSSNYLPIDMWNAGCQIVALNFQTPGEEMDIYMGKFRDNGFAGYNLKPTFLREKKPTFDPKNLQKEVWLNQKKLHVMVISAQQLPKSNMAKPSSVVDPLVTVEVYGVKEDNNQKVTAHISNNGFNPMWNSTFQFDVSVPELAIVRFLVQDYDVSSRNDFIGQFSLPFTSLKLGYRHIHLQSVNGDPLPSASLFVHIMME